LEEEMKIIPEYKKDSECNPEQTAGNAGNFISCRTSGSDKVSFRDAAS
jgi:hypothetical protein